MKIWLNNLKEGDIFYHIMYNKVCKCKHLGDVHNMNYRMPMVKSEILEEKDLGFNTSSYLYDDNKFEVFVNQYVYDNVEEATQALLEKLENDLKDVQDQIRKNKLELENLLLLENKLKNILKENDGKNNKENIKES